MKTYSVSIAYLDLLFSLKLIHLIVEAENKNTALKLCFPANGYTKIIEKSVILIK